MGMSIIDNNALKFLNMLDTKELFMNIDKSHKSKINCNLLFLKMKTYHGKFEYAIQENDSVFNKIVSRIPSDDENRFLSNILELDGDKICKYDITKGYVNESY